MSTITLTAPKGDMPAKLAEARSLLEKAGHTVVVVEEGAPEASVDPLKGVDLNTVPPAVWTALGISREEVERHRQAGPALEHPAGTFATAPQPD